MLQTPEMTISTMHNPEMKLIFEKDRKKDLGKNILICLRELLQKYCTRILCLQQTKEILQIKNYVIPFSDLFDRRSLYL